MLTADFDYSLPKDLIAQHPTTARSASRLLVLDRASRSTTPTVFARLPDFLRPGDLLVLNNSRVIPARLRASKIDGGGQVEMLLLEPGDPGTWWVLLRPGKRVRPGTRLQLKPNPDSRLGDPSANVIATVHGKNADGHCLIGFPPDIDVLAFAETHGEMPLPPYISRSTPDITDRERYQTVYASTPGSAAAPTAGLHFDREFLGALRASGIHTCEVTLHVGVGTFAPVKTEQLEDHAMHTERFFVPEDTVDLVHQARDQGRRVIAIGTTSLRVIESVARQNSGRLVAGAGRTQIFLHPPSRFHVTDALLTNFHLPRSTLLMLVSAFAAPGETHGRELVMDAYRLATELGFRFFSYGDAMLLV